MSTQDGATPEEGELVVATITTVKQNGAYVLLDEYEGIEGFIFIGEIASGWVKNIRGFVREGSASFAKSCEHDVTGHRLSCPEVGFRRTPTGPPPRMEERTAGPPTSQGSRRKVGWNEEQVAEYTVELTDAFGGLYTAFEEAAMQEGAAECRLRG